MHISKFLVETELKGEHVLFSTISKNIIKVSKSFYDEMKNIDVNNLRVIKSEELKYLLDSYFVIEDNVQENKIIEYLLDEDRLNQKIFSSYIAFSTLCNFACVYCYEEGQARRQFVMTEEILQKTIDWYKSIIVKNNYKKCKITLFGGEPLIHKDLIKKFLSAMKDFANLNSVELKIAIITNGYLLEQEIVNFLNDCGLEEIQITLDGVGEIHDKRRPLRTGGPTFDRIIQNIRSLEKFNGRFLFRISFDKNNVAHVKELLKYLKNINIKNNFEVYLAPIHQTTDQNSNPCSFCSKNTAEDITELIPLYKDLFSYMKELDLPIPKYISNGPCMSISKDTVLVDPYGNLFKCVEMIGFDNLTIGNVNEEKYNQRVVNFIGQPNFKRCIKNNCKYTCLCGGGCLMKSYLKDRTLDNLDCQYKLFDELISFLLELNYGK